MVVESYESCDWRKCLSTRQSKLSSGQMHLIKVCRGRDNLSARSSCEKYFSTRVMSTLLDLWCLMVMLCTELKQPVSLND